MGIEYFFDEKIRKNPEHAGLINRMYKKYKEEIENIDDTIFAYGTYGGGSVMIIGLATAVIGGSVLENKELSAIGVMISLGGTVGGSVLGMGIGGIITTIKEKRFYKKIEEELRLENRIT